MPIHSAINNIKKYNVKKYSAFNTLAQEVIEGRMITPNEYAEYYTLIESFHIQPEALLMVMKYCTNLKGNNVGYNYVLTVAKNWALQGITTPESVEQKLAEHERNMGEVKEVLNALKLKRPASFEEMQMFIKWTSDMQFDLGVIVSVAKTFKGKGGFERLESKLLKYFELKLFSIREITEYEKEKDNMFTLARDINKLIGVYYENVETIVDNYINDWLSKGYDEIMLKQIASYCFKRNIRTLEGMHGVIQRFYKLGITSSEALSDYTLQIMAVDGLIKEVLSACGLERAVTSFDRDYYRTWTNSWNFNQNIIIYAASLSSGKTQPLAYMNKVLSEWFNKKVTTIEEAKKQGASVPTDYSQQKKITEHSYSTEELKALFDNIDEVDV